MSYQSQGQYPPRRASWRGYLILLGLVLAIFFVFSTLYPQQFANFTRGLEPSCNIGLGTATVTVQSWSANKDCTAMLANADDFSGVNWGYLGFRSVSEPNTGGSIVCERNLSGRYLTVRDGTMSNNGAIACMEMDGSIIPFPG